MPSKNWRFISFQTKKLGKSYRQVAMFSNEKYGFTGKRMNDRRKAIIVEIAFPKNISPRMASEIGNKRNYSLNELKKMGRVVRRKN